MWGWLYKAQRKYNQVDDLSHAHSQLHMMKATIPTILLGMLSLSTSAFAYLDHNKLDARDSPNSPLIGRCGSADARFSAFLSDFQLDIDGFSAQQQQQQPSPFHVVIRVRFARPQPEKTAKLARLRTEARETDSFTLAVGQQIDLDTERAQRINRRDFSISTARSRTTISTLSDISSLTESSDDESEDPLSPPIYIHFEDPFLPSPLPNSPLIPPVHQQSPPRRKMAPETPCSEASRQRKHSWLQRLEAKFDEDTPVKRKVYQFQKKWNRVEGRGMVQCAPGSNTGGLGPVRDRVQDKWALPATVSLSKDELTRQLNDIRLYEDDLGKTVGEYPDKVYTHVAWAEQPCLPMRLAISATHTGWTTFLDEVTKVSVERLHDHLEVTERRAQDQTPHGRAQPPSRQAAEPVDPIPTLDADPGNREATTGCAAAHTVLDAPPTVDPPHSLRCQRPRTASANVVSRQPDVHKRPDATPRLHLQQELPADPQHTIPPPTTKSPVDLANNAIAKTPSFPNTPEGLMQYREAIQSTAPTEPGTLPIGRKECFLCGMDSTHRSQQCMTQQPLERREQNWRATVNTALYSFRRTETIRVSQIAAEDAPIFYDEAIYGGGIYDAGSLGFDEEYNQGNGQEERT
ncbi:hypothetical protein DFP72DRAFT_1077812 [Ephemerocybe angulata]|uniref:Uncharacterized protein n=1 Tax=Ephemerocybe angulata TaxID=980116 RepID=A0A8H6LVA6_9AGAR|nr:hypothetical protein DFP72DRAFT_1077812 [Tulosesus angulatus]